MRRIGVDIGGTFTDFVLQDGDTLRAYKVLSTPRDPARAVLAGLPPSGSAPVAEVIHGSTVATNAVLERRGARTAFLTTRGFRDLLLIGRQNRRSLYDLFDDRPAPLVPPDLSFEVTERVLRDGTVLTPLSAEEIPPLVERLRAAGVESVAVCLLFSFVRPDHERQLGQALRQAGFHVSLSSQVLPEFREYERASTTALDAYVAPIVAAYLERLEAGLAGVPLRILQSNGGRLSAAEARRHAARTLLSGPAGGVVGAAQVARQAGFDRALTFDMGGTSTDVSLVDGQPHLTTEAELDGLPLRLPVVDIHTIGAGGGSVAWVDAGGALRVGPRSAGADPGPACYGRGGREATVTDANLVLGRLPPEAFTAGGLRLDPEAARRALADLAREAGYQGRGDLAPEEAAALGVVQVAEAHMARALRVISVARGHDPADFVLVAFGGAGGLHAAALARALGVRRVLVPSLAATLSAYGMLAAQVVRDYVQTVMLPDQTPLEDLARRLAPLEAQAARDLAAEGVPPDGQRLFPTLDLRYVGQSYELQVPLGPTLLAAFHQAHEQAYGHSDPAAPVEIVNLRLRAVGAVEVPPRPRLEAAGEAAPAHLGKRPVVFPQGRLAADLYRAEHLAAGAQLKGPALVLGRDTTVLLVPGDRAVVNPYGDLILEVAPDGR